MWVEKVPGDSAFVTLIAEALNGRTRPRRIAAGIILDALKSGEEFDDLPRSLRIVEAEEGRAVAAEMLLLIEEHGLGSGREEGR
jgi:hypothetical protein